MVWFLPCILGIGFGRIFVWVFTSALWMKRAVIFLSSVFVWFWCWGNVGLLAWVVECPSFLLSRSVCTKFDNLLFKNLVEIAWHFLCRSFPPPPFCFEKRTYKVVKLSTLTRPTECYCFGTGARTLVHESSLAPCTTCICVCPYLHVHM